MRAVIRFPVDYDMLKVFIPLIPKTLKGVFKKP